MAQGDDEAVVGNAFSALFHQDDDEFEDGTSGSGGVGGSLSAVRVSVGGGGGGIEG
jgi:hypothetical protein